MAWGKERKRSDIARYWAINRDLFLITSHAAATANVQTCARVGLPLAAWPLQIYGVADLPSDQLHFQTHLSLIRLWSDCFPFSNRIHREKNSLNTEENVATKSLYKKKRRENFCFFNHLDCSSIAEFIFLPGEWSFHHFLRHPWLQFQPPSQQRVQIH